MTIALANSNPVQYSGNGTSVTFSFPWNIFAPTDLVVGFIVGGVYTLQSGGFTVSGVGVNGGGSITFTTAPPIGTTVDIRTQTPEIQPTEFANLSAYLPENTTQAMDRITRVVQDQTRLGYTFSVHGPDTEITAWPALPTASVRANTILGFDANGLPTLALAPATSFTIANFNAFLTIATWTQGIYNAIQAFAPTPQGGTFTGVLTGMSAATSGAITWRTTATNAGVLATLYCASLLGTSNATAMTMTGLPAFLQPAFGQFVCCSLVDGGNNTAGVAAVNPSSGTVTFSRSFVSGTAVLYSPAQFTASGSKGLNATVIGPYLLS